MYISLGVFIDDRLSKRVCRMLCSHPIVINTEVYERKFHVSSAPQSKQTKIAREKTDAGVLISIRKKEEKTKIEGVFAGQDSRDDFPTILRTHPTLWNIPKFPPRRPDPTRIPESESRISAQIRQLYARFYAAIFGKIHHGHVQLGHVEIPPAVLSLVQLPSRPLTLMLPS